MSRPSSSRRSPGVFVDRLDRRLVLIVTNILRGVAFAAIFLVGDNLILIYLLNIFISTVTVFFAPAEAAMIPKLVPRRQLLAANGIFTLTLNAAFALGFALLGPLVVKIAGPQALILIVVAILYFIAAVFCFTLPKAPPPVATPKAFGRATVTETEKAVESVFAQLREGLAYIRGHREIRWSLDLPRGGGIARRRARRARARLRRDDARPRGRRTSSSSSCRSGSASSWGSSCSTRTASCSRGDG